MQLERTKLSDRLLNFAAGVITFVRKSRFESFLSKQILRSATSAGANYEEACSGESRQDFVHKLQIVLKELNETLYWLRLFEKSYLSSSNPELSRLIQENKELCAIIARSVLTTKKHSEQAF
jgi:four helix bundle protein